MFTAFLKNVAFVIQPLDLGLEAIALDCQHAVLRLAGLALGLEAGLVVNQGGDLRLQTIDLVVGLLPFTNKPVLVLLLHLKVGSQTFDLGLEAFNAVFLMFTAFLKNVAFLVSIIPHTHYFFL